VENETGVVSTRLKFPEQMLVNSDNLVVYHRAGYATASGSASAASPASASAATPASASASVLPSVPSPMSDTEIAAASRRGPAGADPDDDL
jgi:hypothetical protein